MKRIGKNLEPPRTLLTYAQAHPDATWDEMRDDNAADGNRAARDCRHQAVEDQYGLCAYCERKISPDDPRHCRVEHFHPKADRSQPWGLNWRNMLAVCDGGSSTLQDERHNHPLPENLSCDAHKDWLIQKNRLSVDCEGALLNPLEVPAFPNLFAFDKGSGHSAADEVSCQSVTIPGNRCGSTAQLVSRTIHALNLNCERLAEKRRLLVVNIDRNKKVLRQKGILRADMAEKLAGRYFNKPWPEFFTTIRCCLGAAAEKYLQEQNYQN